MEKIFDTKYGEVIIRTAMLDINGTDLVSGTEVKLDGDLIGEEIGYRDVEELTIEDAEEYVKKFHL